MFRIAPTAVEVIEDSEFVSFTLERNLEEIRPLVISYEITGVSAGLLPEDFLDDDGFPLNEFPTGTIEMSRNEPSRVLTFNINPDNIEEEDETFFLEVAPVDDRLYGGDGRQMTILNDDGEDLTGPLVFRFFNTDSGVHFYTSDVEEVETIRHNLPSFTFEGEVFRGVSERSLSADEVFRFYNTETGTHFLTASVDEKEFIEEDLDNMVFEGVAFMAETNSGEASNEGLEPVYRFFNTETETHFFTTSASERDFIIENNPEFVSEGISFYVEPLIA